MKRALTGGIALFLLAISNAGAEGGAEGPAATGAPDAQAAADEAPAPATYDVFIDGVTGYAFVKTPAGWKFVRNLKADPDDRGAAGERR